ncbi:MAG: DUF4145 domain-containing protein [Bacillota bacterium]
MRLFGSWDNTRTTSGTSYYCGFCGTNAAPSAYYYCVSKQSSTSSKTTARIYICPNCNKPTYKSENEQVPGFKFGREVKHLPNDAVRELYEEARKCTSIGAFTSSVLACRKLLMNVAVSQGAEEGKSFVEYINFLESRGYIPPGGRTWVDEIRKHGNQATHEIDMKTKEQAESIIVFTEMLLKFIFEFPASVTSTSSS